MEWSDGFITYQVPVHVYYCLSQSLALTLTLTISPFVLPFSCPPCTPSALPVPDCLVWWEWSEPTVLTDTLWVCTHMSSGLILSTPLFCCCSTTHWWLCYTNGSTSQRRFVCVFVCVSLSATLTSTATSAAPSFATTFTTVNISTH